MSVSQSIGCGCFSDNGGMKDEQREDSQREGDCAQESLGWKWCAFVGNEKWQQEAGENDEGEKKSFDMKNCIQHHDR